MVVRSYDRGLSLVDDDFVCGGFVCYCEVMRRHDPRCDCDCHFGVLEVAA
jgi:hypothetical protein